MQERRNPNLGEMLQEFGRIRDEDVARALEFQREHGGYFGEALVALGLITGEELEYALAAQFDLPYVFPEADTIDLDAARLVTPEWAMARVALPISRSGNTLTLVVDSPHRTRAAEELGRSTGLEVLLALASPERIRRLIRDVFQRSDDQPDDRELRPAIRISDLLDRAMADGASKIGVSVRGRAAVGWWEVRGSVHRRLLTAGWARGLDERLSPPVSRGEEGIDPEHQGSLLWEGMDTPVVIRALRTGGGQEILLRPIRDREEGEPPHPAPPATLLADVRMLVKAGAGRFAISTSPPALMDRILQHLPRLLLGPAIRSAHLSTEAAPGEEFSVAVPGTDPERHRFLAELRAFRLDVVTADLGALPEEWEPDVSRAAASSLVALRTERDRAALAALGVPWELRVRQEDTDALSWELTPLATGGDRDG
jgi:hypothetical protein